jgi:Glycosyl hydrolases family 28
MSCMKSAFLLLSLAASAASQSLCTVEKASSQAIQAAIDACSAKGGGVAYLPPGEYVTGPLWLKDNVELRLEAGAVVALSQNLADWPSGPPAIINSYGAKNIAITGRGTIDGRAQYEFTAARGADPEIASETEIARKAGVDMRRYYRTGVQKYAIVLRDSREVRIEGVRIIHSPLWTLRLQDCDQVWIRGVYIYSDLEKGVNADGIDIVSTSNVSISDSTIITADDAICVKTQAWRGSGPVRRSENITVSNCILSSSSTPMVIGTETYADIRHVLFSNIVVRDSNRVFGINVQDGAVVSDVRFQNVTFETRRRHWNWWGSAEVFKFVLKKRSADSPLGRIENVTIDGAQGVARGTSLIAGHADRPLENIAIQNLRVKMLPEERPDKRATHAIVIERVDGLTLRNIDVNWDERSPEPAWGSALVLRDVSRLILDGFRGRAGSRDPGTPAIIKQRVNEQGAN